MAQDEQKLVFLYLHSPNHPFTPRFCKDILCSEVVVQFLDAFLVRGMASRTETRVCIWPTLRPASFPFCAIVPPHSGDSFAVQQMEGPVTPEEPVEMLQTTLEEQELAFDNKRAKEEKRRADIQLRQEQEHLVAPS